MDPFRIAVTASTVLLCGALVGSGVAPLLANELFSHEPHLARPLELPTVADRVAAEVNLAALGDPGLPPPGDPPTPPDEDDAAPCEDDIVLVGVAHVGADETRSLAAIRAEGRSRSIRVDEEVGDYTLLRTGHARATLRRRTDGSTCTLALFGEQPEAPEASPPPVLGERPRVLDPRAAAARERASSAITEVSNGHYAVDRGFVQGILMGGRTRNAIPVERDGAVVGVQLRGLRGLDPDGRGGLRDRDLVTAVDGQPVDQIDHAMEAYARLLAGEAVALSIERDGQVLQRRYELR